MECEECGKDVNPSWYYIPLKIYLCNNCLKGKENKDGRSNTETS